MAVDIDPNIQLFVSDIRENILVNLRQRMKDAGITKFQWGIADLTVPGSAKQIVDQKKFDLIIADVPCSGSGTWGRTPEQLLFFDPAQIDQYKSRQQKIVDQVIPYLGTRSYFLYITCSVYRQENEDMIRHIQDHHHSLQLIQSNLLKGYEIGADTMFAALFQRKL